VVGGCEGRWCMDEFKNDHSLRTRVSV
jgi:hypothetical protein